MDKTTDPVHEFAQNYEFRADDGDYTPAPHERAMIEDAIHGYLSTLSPDSGERMREAGLVRAIADLLEKWEAIDREFAPLMCDPHAGDYPELTDMRASIRNAASAIAPALQESAR